MSKQRTIAGIPLVTRPGQPGIRRSNSGGFWVPIGINPYSRKRDGQPYFSRVQARRQWEQQRAAGARYTHSKVHVHIAQCSRCGMCVGRGYIRGELYLYPRLKKDAFDWELICDRCAVEAFRLPFAFCLIAERDWEGPHKDQIVARWSKAYLLKCQQLTNALVRLWVEYDHAAKALWLKHGGRPNRYPRQIVLEEFVASSRAPVATFTQLYKELFEEDRAA